MYIKKILLIIVAASLVFGAIFSYNIYNKIFKDNTSFEKDRQEVFIPENTDFNGVLTILKPYLKEAESFAWLAHKKGYSTRVKPGRYIILKGSNNNDLIGNLRSNNVPVKVSFNNQERLENLAGRVAEQIQADSISLLQIFKDQSFLKKNNFTKETAITMYIPNSYEIFWNTSAEAFRAKMLKEYHRFWNAEKKAKAEKIGLTPTEVTTLASIVHKETVKIKERPKVAGVYMNRLKKGMKLDADPTVIYALKKSTNSWDTVIKRVLRKDLKIKNAYNTYKNRGLPPGPIVMPDISAVNAVLNYQRHNYYYFVADVENFGFHKFSSSLSQHNRYSAQYHKWVNSKGIRR